MTKTRLSRFGTAVLAGVCAGGLLVGAVPVAIAAPQPVTVDQQARHWRGTPVSVVPVDQRDRDAVAAYLKKSTVDTARVRYGVRAFRVVYRTVRPDGSPTTASALLVLPRRPERTLHQAMWLHGTTLYRRGVASMTGDRSDRPTAYAIAAAGYAVTAPDYLGLGDSTDTHPYDHLPSTATASLDALRAGRAVAAGHGLRLHRDVLVTGHSQGGAAVLAVGRVLPEAGLRAGVLAPLSGPFDIQRLIDATLADETPNGSAYLAYLATAWNRLHHLYPTDAAMFRAPYDRLVPPLFDGEHTEQEVLPQLPPKPSELFTDEMLAQLREPTGAWRRAVAQAGSACDWRPDVPVTLYTARGDRDVPSYNARYCAQAVRAHGGRASVVDVGDVDHATMALRSLPRVLATFDEHTR